MLLFPVMLFAQEGDDSFVAHIRDYSGYLGSGLRHTVADRHNQVLMGSVGISVLLLRQYDQSVKEYAQDKGLMSEELSHVLDLYGGRWAYPVTLAAVGATSFLKGEDREEGVRKLKYVGTSLVVTALFTDLLKWATHRERPNQQGQTSFPSGHTSGSFVVAATMDELYGHRIGIPAYLVAALVGLQRIHDNKHWLSDVLAGATLGMAIGRGFGAAYRKERGNDTVGIAPAASARGVRLVVAMAID